MLLKENIDTVSISKQSFFKLILFVIIVLLIIYIRYLLLTLAISFILASFTKYFAQLLQKKYKINYKYGLAFIFIFLTSVFVLGIVQLFPLLIREGYGLFETISIFIKSFEEWISFIGLPLDTIKISQFANLIPNLGEVTVGVLGLFSRIITYIVLIFVLAFYIAINEVGVNKLIQIFVPKKIKDNIPDIVKKLEYHIGRWAFMEASLALIIGIFIYTAISILGFKYASILAILSSMAQFVPILGPTLISLIIVIYAFLQSPLLGFIAILLIISLQIIKQFLLLPIIFNHYKSTNTLLIVFSLMVGGVLAGPLGVFIAMPLVSLAKIIYIDIRFYDKQ